MNQSFPLDFGALAAQPRFAPLAAALSAVPALDSGVTFNHFCREALHTWGDLFPAGLGKTSRRFTEFLECIERRPENVIPTGWGGVVVTLHEPPRVEKFLVIRAGRYLALEKHELKDERLQVEEGAGLILFRRSLAEPLGVQALAPGDVFHFGAGMEHCVIGTENLLIFERSIDPKGMDQDLIFIFEPDAAPAGAPDKLQ